MAKTTTTKKTVEKKEPAPVLESFKVTAVIPTVQYGNIQPEYTVRATSFEKAEEAAMPYIEKFWAKYCQKGSELTPNNANLVASKAIKMTSPITGESANFDEYTHTYTTDDGKVFLSGSTFCKKFVKPFAKDDILEMMVKKYAKEKLTKQQIADMWKLKGEVSTSFGTSIHAALEMYGKYQSVGLVTGNSKGINSALHDHPYIKEVVEKFFEARQNEVALYEPPVIDTEKLLCGQIDRFLIANRDKKVCRIQDYKTNVDVEKKGYNGTLLAPFTDFKDVPLSAYWLQLSFYAHIVKKYGWTVEALDVLHWNPEKRKWVTFTREPIDLESRGVL